MAAPTCLRVRRGVHRLADAADQHRALVLTLTYTGIRWGETVALGVREVEFFGVACRYRRRDLAA
jgi:hypothetical protein